MDAANKTQAKMIETIRQHGYVTFEVGVQTCRLQTRSFGTRELAAARALADAGVVVFSSKSETEYKGSYLHKTYTYRAAK